MAIAERQQQRLQLCGNNWVRKIARVPRANRSAEELDFCLTERLVRSRLQWAGHVGRMADDRLPKRAAELREEGRMRRGRPRLRWEDYVERDARCEEGRRGGRLEEEDKRQGRVEKTIR